TAFPMRWMTIWTAMAWPMRRMLSRWMPVNGPIWTMTAGAITAMPISTVTASVMSTKPRWALTRVIPYRNPRIGMATVFPMRWTMISTAMAYGVHRMLSLMTGANGRIGMAREWVITATRILTVT